MTSDEIFELVTSVTEFGTTWSEEMKSKLQTRIPFCQVFFEVYEVVPQRPKPFQIDVGQFRAIVKLLIEIELGIGNISLKNEVNPSQQEAFKLAVLQDLALIVQHPPWRSALSKWNSETGGKKLTIYYKELNVESTQTYPYTEPLDVDYVFYGVPVGSNVYYHPCIHVANPYWLDTWARYYTSHVVLVHELMHARAIAEGRLSGTLITAENAISAPDIGQLLAEYALIGLLGNRTLLKDRPLAENSYRAARRRMRFLTYDGDLAERKRYTPASSRSSDPGFGLVPM